MTTAHEFAQSWHRALFDGNMGLAWRLMTEDFRRVIAQVALQEAWRNGEDVDPLVEELAPAAPARADLQHFFDAACALLKNACGAPPDMVVPGATIRIEAPTYEVVRLYMREDLTVDGAGTPYLRAGEAARAITLIVAADELGTWRMAGVGAVMSPGWPPKVSWSPPAEI